MDKTGSTSSTKFSFSVIKVLAANVDTSNSIVVLVYLNLVCRKSLSLGLDLDRIKLSLGAVHPVDDRSGA